MEATTIKLHKTTKLLLDNFKQQADSYDTAVIKLISSARQKGLKKQLVEAYQNKNAEDILILNEWEPASYELQ